MSREHRAGLEEEEKMLQYPMDVAPYGMGVSSDCFLEICLQPNSASFLSYFMFDSDYFGHYAHLCSPLASCCAKRCVPEKVIIGND